MTRARYAPGQVEQIHIKRHLSTRPVERYLATRLSLRQGLVTYLLKKGCVSLNGTPLDSDPGRERAFDRGDRFEIRFPLAWPPHLQPTPIPLKILYEDSDLLVLDKPPGVVVHPARGHMDNSSLQNGVLHHVRDRLGQPGVTVGPCHRLDKDTSGVIVYGITHVAYRHLTEQFAAHGPHKSYLAVVDGVPPFSETEIRAPLATDPDNPTRIAVRPEHDGGKPAETSLYVLERGTNWALLRATPRTGKPHQIRVHCRHAGHPIFADADYHPHVTSHHDLIQRQALHAEALSFDHPRTGERLRFEAPLPDDIQTLLQTFRTERSNV